MEDFLTFFLMPATNCITELLRGSDGGMLTPAANVETCPGEAVICYGALLVALPITSDNQWWFRFLRARASDPGQQSGTGHGGGLGMAGSVFRIVAAV